MLPPASVVPKAKKSTSGESHVGGSGMGDYYGPGIKAKVGTMREQVGVPMLKNKQLGKPPKALA